ncbi:hypothetical protein NMG60_11021031 [Bertholletia excelsa]
MKKTELKVNMYCSKCRTQVLKAVTTLRGIDQVSVDRDKGTVTVVGDADPVSVASQIRKVGKVAEIISVGASKPPETK